MYNLDGSALLQREVNGQVKGVAFSPDGNLLACALEPSRLRASGRTSAMPHRCYRRCDLRADGTRLAMGLPSGVVELWGVGIPNGCSASREER